MRPENGIAAWPHWGYENKGLFWADFGPPQGSFGHDANKGLMRPEWILAGLGVLQVVSIAFLWRVQLLQARQAAAMKEWVHAEYMPRELAEARFVHKPEISGFSAVSKPMRANS